MGILDAPVIPKDNTGRRIDSIAVPSVDEVTLNFLRSLGNVVPGSPVVAINRVWHSEPTSTSANVNGFTWQCTYKITAACTDVRLVYPGWITTTASPFEGGTTNLYPIKASLLFGGRRYPVGFGQTQLATLESGGLLVSNPIGLHLAAGDTITILTNCRIQNGEKFPGIVQCGGAPGYTASTDGFGQGDMTNSGTITSNTGLYANPLLFGRLLAPARTITVLGDSITHAEGDTGLNAPGGSLNRNYGWVTRGNLNRWGMMRLGAPGYTTTMMLSTPRWASFMQSCTDVFIALGTNDLGGGLSLAATKTQLQTLAQMAKDRGKRVTIATLLPRTTSTDAWATTTNQTFFTSGFTTTFEADRQALNAWIRSKPSPFDEFVDPAAAVEVNAAGALSLTGGYWKPSASTPFTADGTHPSAVGAQAIADVIDFKMPAA